MVQSHPKHGFPTFPWRQGSQGAIELPRLHFCTRLLVSDLMASWGDWDPIWWTEISIPWIYDADMNYHVDAISMVQRQLMETTASQPIFLHSDSWRMTSDLWGTISWSSKTRIFSVESRPSKHDVPHSGCLHNWSGSRMPWCSRTSPSTRGRAAVHRHLRSIHRAWETMWCVKLPGR